MGFDKSLFYIRVYYRLLEINFHIRQAVAKPFRASGWKAGFSTVTALEMIHVCALQNFPSLRIVWKCLRKTNSVSDV